MRVRDSFRKAWSICYNSHSFVNNFKNHTIVNFSAEPVIFDYLKIKIGS